VSVKVNQLYAIMLLTAVLPMFYLMIDHILPDTNGAHGKKYPQFCSMIPLGSRCDGAQRGELPCPPKRGDVRRTVEISFNQ